MEKKEKIRKWKNKNEIINGAEVGDEKVYGKKAGEQWIKNEEQ